MQAQQSDVVVTPSSPQQRNSNIGKVWVFIAIFAILLLLLLIFVAQNSNAVQIKYFGYAGTIDFGVAMLLSAVAGCILTVLVGSIRIIQLKLSNKKL